MPGRWRSFYENIAEALQDRKKLAVRPESVRAVMAVVFLATGCPVFQILPLCFRPVVAGLITL